MYIALLYMYTPLSRLITTFFSSSCLLASLPWLECFVLGYILSLSFIFPLVTSPSPCNHTLVCNNKEK